MKDDWTKDIKGLMDGHEVKAPEGLLDDIKAEMGRRGLSPAAPPQPRAVVVPMWRRVAVAAAVAVAAGVALWLLWPDEKADNLAKTTEQTPAAQKTSQPAISDLNERENKDEEGGLNRSYVAQSGVVQPMAGTTHEGLANTMNGGLADTMTESQGVAVNVAEANGKAEEKPAASTKGKPADKRQTRRRSEVEEQLAREYEAAMRHSEAGNTISLMAYYGGTSSASGVGMNGGVVLADARPYGNYSADMASPNTNVPVDMEKDEVKVHHRQPVKVGVSIGYRVAPRWSVRTGVTYSYLSSDFTSKHDARRTQRLHYVGVPVMGSYSIVRSKKAEVYVTAGGEVEKLVKGTSEVENYEREKVKESRPQFSVKAAAGAAYSFTPGVSVYVEPGVAHYFDNHSSVVNVYKDKPTSFSLNLGLRVNLNQ